MYLVFIAMLALNLSTDVLDGFDIINDNIRKNIVSATVRNNQLFEEIGKSYNANPEKTGAAYYKAQRVKVTSDSLFNYIQHMKQEIALKTDGANADVNDLDYRENQEATSEVMLAPLTGHAKKLKTYIEQYRDSIATLIQDPSKVELIKNGLSTEPTNRAKKANKSWEEASFELMPSNASITYLSELQYNIKTAEGEALSNLLRNIDVSDIRVNELNAIVIPESNIVMRGMNYKANIMIAAVDTTQRPRVVINGKEIPNGLFQTIASGSSGSLDGFVELMGRDGLPIRKNFRQDYTVIEPMATIAPLLMDVVYAGIDNPISISVPGFAGKDVTATAEGGGLVRNASDWIAKPTTVGGKFVINVSANVNGTHRSVARKEFRIRALPDPVAYIDYKDAKGNFKMFKQGGLSRTILLESKGIKAAIDDGILNIPFTILGFKTIFVDAMGDAIPEVSSGANFSSRQLEQIKRLERGKSFFVSGIRVKGPDGREREISPMEIRVN